LTYVVRESAAALARATASDSVLPVPQTRMMGESGIGEAETLFSMAPTGRPTLALIVCRLSVAVTKRAYTAASCCEAVVYPPTALASTSTLPNTRRASAL